MSAIPSWCRVGAKVVCVHSDWSVAERMRFPDVSFPEVRETYTIREITDCYPGAPLCLRLSEVVNPLIIGIEPAFYVARFRPLVTLEDDITTYFADLLDVREPVEA